MDDGLADRWASGLGLIQVPLFAEQSDQVRRHSVLLDGGRGSFALSISHGSRIDDDAAASWIWSADLPHYVNVDENSVTLSRWDDPASIRRFKRSSVENRLESFYDYLRLDRVQSRLDIVGHSIDIFRRVRNLVYEYGIPDEASVHIFLFVLSRMMAEHEAEGATELEPIVSAYALDPSFLEVYRNFGPDTLESLTTQFRSPIGTARELQQRCA